MKFVRVAMLSSMALSLAACVSPTTVRPDIDSAAGAAEMQKQAAFVVQSRLEDERRVMNIAERLLQANVDQCPVTRRTAGMDTATAHEVGKRYRQAVRDEMGLGDAPALVWVRPGGPAEAAGLKPGDQILAVNGAAVPPGAKAAASLRKALDAALEGPGDLTLKVRRGPEEVSAAVRPETICGYKVVLENSEEINAYADGARIIITRGIMRFTPKDEELALVIAHELAHNTERHMRAQKTNSAAGVAGGVAVDVLFAAFGVDTGGAFTRAGGNMGAGFASAEFEEEADYVGMYYLARAGFETDGVENYWRKMAVESPSAIFVRSSHPATPQRYLAIARTDDEIRAKRSRGEPLIPNRIKKTEAAAAPSGK